MIDINSAECIIKAAARCLEVVSARIAADPTSPLVPDLQAIADQAQAIINENERREQHAGGNSDSVHRDLPNAFGGVPRP